MRIAVVGGYGVGMTMRVRRPPAEGETVLADGFSAGPGGKGANQAVAARRLGAEVSLLTAVGDDAYGRDAFAFWASEGIDTRYVRVTDSGTMVAWITVEPNGDNRIIVAPGALDDLSPEADIARFAGELGTADVAVAAFEIPWPVALAGLRVAADAGVRTILNPAPAAVLPSDAYGCVDILTPNVTEAQLLVDRPGESNPDALVDAFGELASPPGNVVLTLGADGVLVAEGLRDGGGRRTHVSAVAPAEIVDTTGAGDAFTGALAVAVAEGRTLVEAARFAAAAGAFAVGRAEVIPGLPYRHDLPG